MKVFYCFSQKNPKQLKAGITMPKNGGIDMKLVRKLVSLALSVMVVAGCGAIVNADTTRFKIDSNNFPDDSFRKYVSTKFDTNKNGYLDSSERYSQTYVYLDGSDAKSIEGIEILNVSRLVIFSSDVKAVDLTDTTSITNVVIYNCPDLTSFKGNSYQKLVEISFCKNLDKIDVTKCLYLNELNIFENPKLTGLNLSKNKYITTLRVTDCKGITSISFNSTARFRKLDICGTSITHMDLSDVVNLKTIKYLQITFVGKYQFSFLTDMYNLLQISRTGNNGITLFYTSDV